MSQPVSVRYRDRIEPHLNALYRAAYRLAGNGADAEDLVQDTCLKAFSRIQAFIDSRSPRNWLLRVQYHLFVDGKRLVEHDRVRPLAPGELGALAADELSTPDSSAEAAQAETELLDAWAKLNTEQRALIALRAEGFSLLEIEEITGLAVSVIGARLHRARQSLGRLLRESALADNAIQRKESLR